MKEDIFNISPAILPSGPDGSPLFEEGAVSRSRTSDPGTASEGDVFLGQCQALKFFLPATLITACKKFFDILENPLALARPWIPDLIRELGLPAMPFPSSVPHREGGRQTKRGVRENAKNFLHSVLIVIGILFLLPSCIDPVAIDIPPQQPLLVVDGLITDQPGPYTVKLSLSSPINQLASNPVEGARVFLEEEGGARAELNEIKPGAYQSDSLSIRGQVGKRYRLEVELAADRHYQTDWISLKAAPPVGEVNYDFGPLPGERIFVQGVKLYVNAADPSQQTRFYRWEWEDSWMHIAPLASGLIFLGNDSVAQGPVKGICYNHSRSHSIYIASSVGNAEDVISQFHLHTVSGFGSQLRYRYSLLVKQYALDEAEFLFWKAVQEANENPGTLYERQPQSTTGNVFRVEDETEPVLGYFSVSGYSEKRIFIERGDLPSEAVIGEQYLLNCFVKADTLFQGLESERDVFNAIGTGFVFYNFLRDPDIVGWILATPDCADCTEEGGTTQKPDFW